MRYLLIGFILLSTHAKSQRIVDFTLNSAANIVTGKFVITAGSTCSGFTVFRSTDSLNYYQIFDSPQICGNSFTPETKSFSDASPALNQINYYKVLLQPFDVAYAKIFVGQNQGSNLVPYPNPVYQGNSTLNLKLINGGNAIVTGHLFNQGARSIQKLELRTYNDLTEINIAGLENGVYLVWLTDGRVAYSCKFIIFN
jgi:hypothetical protein